MIKLNIAGKKYYYKSRQSEIDFKLGEELEKLRAEYPCDCDLEFQRWCLTLLCGCTFDEADMVSDEQVARLISVHPFFSPNILTKFKQYIKVKGKLYQYRDLNKPMTIREYTLLDMMANDKDFISIIKKLYLPVTKKVKEGYLKYYFRLLYVSLLIKNTKSIEDCNYFELQLAMFYFFQWKRKLMQDYTLTMDNPNIPAEDQADEVIQTPEEKFGMYHVLMSVCGDDMQKFQWWLDRDISELFKYIMYLRIKGNK
jgi:hypothetical protein